MVSLVESLRLAGYALGAVGGAFVFVEFFQLPSYVSYDEDFGWDLDISPQELREHTWIGRIGGGALSLGFALLFIAQLMA